MLLLAAAVWAAAPGAPPSAVEWSAYAVLVVVLAAVGKGGWTILKWSNARADRLEAALLALTPAVAQAAATNEKVLDWMQQERRRSR